MPVYSASMLKILGCEHGSHDRATVELEGYPLELNRCLSCGGITIAGTHGIYVDPADPDSNRGLLELARRAIETHRINEVLMTGPVENDPRWDVTYW